VGQTPGPRPTAPSAFLHVDAPDLIGEERVRGDPRGPGGPPHNYARIRDSRQQPVLRSDARQRNRKRVFRYLAVPSTHDGGSLAGNDSSTHSSTTSDSSGEPLILFRPVARLAGTASHSTAPRTRTQPIAAIISPPAGDRRLKTPIAASATPPKSNASRSPRMNCSCLAIPAASGRTTALGAERCGSPFRAAPALDGLKLPICGPRGASSPNMRVEVIATFSMYCEIRAHAVPLRAVFARFTSLCRWRFVAPPRRGHRDRRGYCKAPMTAGPSPRRQAGAESVGRSGGRLAPRFLPG
jgi:hypothetical protein